MKWFLLNLKGCTSITAWLSDIKCGVLCRSKVTKTMSLSKTPVELGYLSALLTVSHIVPQTTSVSSVCLGVFFTSSPLWHLCKSSLKVTPSFISSSQHTACWVWMSGHLGELVHVPTWHTLLNYFLDSLWASACTCLLYHCWLSLLVTVHLGKFFPKLSAHSE